MGKQPISLNPNHIFVDTNVLIGAYSGDAHYQADSDCLHYLCSTRGKRLYISTLSVAQLVSVYQKKSNEEITRVVRDLQQEIRPMNIEARYPDYKRSIANTLGEEKTRQIVEQTKQMQQWILQECSAATKPSASSDDTSK